MKRIHLIAVGATALAVAVGACGGTSGSSGTGSASSSSGSSSSTRPGPATASTPSSTATSSAPEVNPPGDIPDNQAFVSYAPPAGGFRIKVPEGWARVESGGAVTFTDKLNSIRIEAAASATAPTVQSAQQIEVPTIEAAAKNFRPGKVTSVTRKAGIAVLITYEADSSPDAVTAKVVHDEVERYEFWKAGTEVILTLSGPKGADNVDPWRIVTDSFGWQ